MAEGVDSMWDYTDTVLEHFRNPRNVGVVENPDGVGEVGTCAAGVLGGQRDRSRGRVSVTWSRRFT